MSVTLSNEQFQALLESATSKKKVEVSDRSKAVNIDEFIAGFHFLPVSQLLNTEKPDFFVDSIIDNISGLEDNELPFYCSNYQTKNYYYKENNEWKKGTDFIKKLYSIIYKNSMKQIMENFSYNNNSNEFDDEKSENNYSHSDYCEKQRMICKLCDVDKYPYSKCVDKMLIKLGKRVKQ